MKLSLSEVPAADQGLLAPCGIICMGCDLFQHESLAACKKVIEIWEGFNLPDVAPGFNMNSKNISAAIETMKLFVEIREKSGACPGCFKGGGPSKICSIAKCVKSKGYWTCAECEDFTSEVPNFCPHEDPSKRPIGSRNRASVGISKRYNSNNIENLIRCREIGYAAFIKEMKEKVKQGWRTWQVISREKLFTRQ